MSRADLPGGSSFQFPAQTHTGQVTFADSIFIRDLAHPSYQTMWNYEPTQEKVVKLVALFDFLGFPDCAAELIRAFPSFLPPDASTELLDLLVQSAGEQGPYDSFISRFEANPRDWMPAPIVEVVSEAPAPSLEITPPAPEPPPAAVEVVTEPPQTPVETPPAPESAVAIGEDIDTYRRRLAAAHEQIRELKDRAKRWRDEGAGEGSRPRPGA